MEALTLRDPTAAPVAGRFGRHGGRFVPEPLIPACEEVEVAFAEDWCGDAARTVPVIAAVQDFCQQSYGRGPGLIHGIDPENPPGQGVYPIVAVTDAVRAEAERLGLTGNGSFELREVAELPLTGTGVVDAQVTGEGPSQVRRIEQAGHVDLEADVEVIEAAQPIAPHRCVVDQHGDREAQGAAGVELEARRTDPEHRSLADVEMLIDRAGVPIAVATTAVSSSSICGTGKASPRWFSIRKSTLMSMPRPMACAVNSFLAYAAAWSPALRA